METLKISSEVLTQLEDLAIKHNISVDKVVESLLYFYQQNSVVELTAAEEEALNEAIERDEADQAAGFKGYSSEEVREILQQTLLDYQKNHSQGAV